MGQKVHPRGFRLCVSDDAWDSKWYAEGRTYTKNLIQDGRLRDYVRRELRGAAIHRVIIERAGARVRVKLLTARPGFLIGRRGQERDKIKLKMSEILGDDLMLDIQEVEKPALVAQLVAESIALQLERRVSFRRAMKKAQQAAMFLEAQCIKIAFSGRLGGSEIARRECLRWCRVSLHTLRENIDYGFFEAHTVYGLIGVKCWLCV